MRKIRASSPAKLRVLGLSNCILALVLCSGCRNQNNQKTEGGEILVSAAVSLKEAFGEIAGSFEASSGSKVVFNFGGSGELQKQIEQGAPADVFASAAEREMDELDAKGLIDSQSRKDFAENSLVLIVPAAAHTPLLSFQEVNNPKFMRIAIGNPQTVPAGHYGQQALENNQLWGAVKNHLILSENVRQVLEYVAHGEVDAGLVYSTDVEVARGRVKIVAQAPEGTYGPIRYPIAVVKGSRHAEAAAHFLKFVLSTEGQDILKRHGFVMVNRK